MSVVKPSYQEWRGQDLYIWTAVAESTAKRGIQKVVRFWISAQVQVQGWIEVPADTVDNAIVKLEGKELASHFFLQKFIGKYDPSYFNITQQWHGRDLYLVVRIK